MAALTEYLDMGGYAPFIWSAYGIAVMVMTAIAVVSWRGYRRLQAQLQAEDPRAAGSSKR